MATIVEERVTVEDAGEGLLRVHLVQVHDNRVDLSGDLVLDRSAAPWLAATVARAVTNNAFADVDERIGPDHFLVYVGGSEMQPFVNIHNHRDSAAPFGRLYVLSFSIAAAEHLAQSLRDVQS
jgi:hypothetical protein